MREPPTEPRNAGTWLRKTTTYRRKTTTYRRKTTTYRRKKRSCAAGNTNTQKQPEKGRSVMNFAMNFTINPDNLQKWSPRAWELAQPLEKLPVPFHVLAGEALDVARFA